MELKFQKIMNINRLIFIIVRSDAMNL